MMTVLIVLAKAPLPGRVKTRLTPPLTGEQAAGVAAAALADTFAAARASTASSATVAVFDGEPSPWVPTDVVTMAQTDGGLDRRLAAAFNSVHAAHGEAMVLIAMDTPQVTAALLDDAMQSLAAPGVDAVFGPADDGGYWLIGLRPLRADEPNYDALFHDVPMSTKDTGEAQRARLLSLGWAVRDITSLRDIDTVDDIAHVAKAFPELGVSAAWRIVSEEACPCPEQPEACP